MSHKNYEDMMAGRAHDGGDAYLFELKREAAKTKEKLDAIPNDDFKARIEANKDLFAEGSGPAIVLSPFSIQYGRHVKIGKWSFVNFGATFLDGNMITLGDHVAVGPNVQFITATHPLRSEDRIKLMPDQFPPFEVVNIAHPIHVGDFAWIGAGAIIMPGVTIGPRAVVGAGSVVTKDVPSNMVVAGNPAKLMKSVDD